MTPGRRAAVLALVSQYVSAYLRDATILPKWMGEGGATAIVFFLLVCLVFSFFPFYDSLTYWPGNFAMSPMEEIPEAPRTIKSKLLEGGTSLARG